MFTGTAQPNKGFSLVEAVLAGALLGILTTGILGIVWYGEQSIAEAGNRNRAIFLADEALEAVRSIQDANFNDVTAGTHGLSVQNHVWTFSGVSDATDIFSRKVTVHDIDANHKEISASVEWSVHGKYFTQITATTSLTRWH